jgi:hypothetical protein
LQYFDDVSLNVMAADEESGASYALKLTAAGAKAIVVDDAAEPEDAGEASDALANRDQAAILSKLAAKDARPSEAMEPGPIRPPVPRGRSKLARVIALLERDHGATIEELIAATGWLAHTSLAGVKRLMDLPMARPEQWSALGLRAPTER